MSQGFYGFPNILGLFRATCIKVLGKPGATNGLGLAGGTVSGAPTTGAFDSGDIVVDASGALFICTVAGSPGTWVQVGTLVDPLTTRGDILVRGASATTRLALGTTNYVLTSNGTDVTWGVSPASAGGALTQLAQTVIGSTTASITLSSISGAYNHLLLVVQAISTVAAVDDTLMLQINSDTASHYDYSYIHLVPSAAVGGARAAAQTAIQFWGASGATATAGAVSSCSVLLPGYAGTSLYKQIQVSGMLSDGNGTGIYATTAGAQWRSTAAVTALKVFPAAGSFAAGSVATLYGVS